MKAPRALKGLAAYLTDWKNLLAHAVVGVALVLIPLVLPIPTAGRIAVFIAIVLANSARMAWDRKRKAAKAAAAARTAPGSAEPETGRPGTA